MRAPSAHFSGAQRLLHWLMAALVTAMLFIGIGMVATLSPRYWTLVSIHRPLGIAILVLVVLRLALRLRRGSPPLPADIPWPQAMAAKASQVLLYGLMILMPLLGWSMLSAGGYPIVLYGPWRLPPIVPHNDALYSLLRTAHHYGAFLLFAVILVHIAAALFHGLVRHDGVLSSMAPWSRRQRRPATRS